MKVVISSGHGKYIRGASGYLDEVDEARKVVERVAEFWRAEGVGVDVFHDDVSTSQNANLNAIVDYHNARIRNYDVSVHFNAYATTSKPMGCEVLYVTQSKLAADVSLAIAQAGAFINRGAKYRSDLFFLNSTQMPAILIETCFVDSSADTELYRQHFDSICKRIAEVIGKVSVDEIPEAPEEIPPTEPPTEITGNNRVEITTEVEGHVTFYVNGTLVRGHEGYCEHMAKFNVKLVGDAKLVINGEEFNNPASTIDANHRNIEATVFGGSDDPNNSAYPPYTLLHGDRDSFVALPYSFPLDLFPDNPPKVRVYHGELSAVGEIADKGPWTTDDSAYVKGSARPIAETCHLEETPLPSGPNKGTVPSNKAGIDLSPALAKQIGIKGKGVVDWKFEDDAVA